MRLYIEGYVEAADRLAQETINSGSKIDILVFPISFLYRQYIELQLKEIIRESRVLLNNQESFPKSHNLDHLLDTANKLLTRIAKTQAEFVDNHITQTELNTIKEIIKDFITVDPESIAFRYPTDKNGQKNLAKIRHINIRKLRDQMKELKENLGKYYNCIYYLREDQDNKNGYY